jgi:hypothetical protein
VTNNNSSRTAAAAAAAATPPPQAQLRTWQPHINMEGHITACSSHGGRKNISPFAAPHGGPALLSPFAALAPTFLLGQQPPVHQQPQQPSPAADVHLATTQQQQQQQQQQAGVNNQGQLLQQQQNVMLHAQEDLMRVRVWACCGKGLKYGGTLK